jgi:hypothetical protein
MNGARANAIICSRWFFYRTRAKLCKSGSSSDRSGCRVHNLARQNWILSGPVWSGLVRSGDDIGNRKVVRSVKGAPKQTHNHMSSARWLFYVKFNLTTIARSKAFSHKRSPKKRVRAEQACARAPCALVEGFSFKRVPT